MSLLSLLLINFMCTRRIIVLFLSKEKNGTDPKLLTGTGTIGTELLSSKSTQKDVNERTGIEFLCTGVKMRSRMLAQSIWSDGVSLWQCVLGIGTVEVGTKWDHFTDTKEQISTDLTCYFHCKILILIHILSSPLTDTGWCGDIYILSI